jgi:hypothetical protein
MIRSIIINIVLKHSRRISNSLTISPIAMRSRLQVVSMVMEREREGDGGNGTAVPSPQMKWISDQCVSFAVMRIIYGCLHKICLVLPNEGGGMWWVHGADGLFPY